jgi:catechol 2,3-dioxygenase-like lactoylglutathione lyase family enzyme
VVINVQDMNRAVDFWTAVLGYVRREQAWDPEFMMLVDPAARRLQFPSSWPAPRPRSQSGSTWTSIPANRRVMSSD